MGVQESKAKYETKMATARQANKYANGVADWLGVSAGALAAGFTVAKWNAEFDNPGAKADAWIEGVFEAHTGTAPATARVGRRGR